MTCHGRRSLQQTRWQDVHRGSLHLKPNKLPIRSTLGSRVCHRKSGQGFKRQSAGAPPPPREVPIRTGGRPPALHQNQHRHTSGRMGYITPAVWGDPNASERGAQSEMAHKWAGGGWWRTSSRFLPPTLPDRGSTAKMAPNTSYVSFLKAHKCDGDAPLTAQTTPTKAQGGGGLGRNTPPHQ